MENNACITLKLLLHKHASKVTLTFTLNQKPWTELISIPLAAFCLLKVTRHQQMIQRFKLTPPPSTSIVCQARMRPRRLDL